MALAALVLGNWVTHRIERGVVNNSATSAAVFMESFISPVSHEFSDPAGLTDPSRSALREIFLQSALGDRIVSYKIWGDGGEIIEASNAELVGQIFELSEDQNIAWTGKIAASFEDLSDAEDAAESALGIPLLEVYSPVFDAWTGEVVAVAEFYENGTSLAAEIGSARRNTWLVVAVVFLLSAACLVGLVEAAGRQIERQRIELKERLRDAECLSRQNATLTQRVRLAAARSTAQSDRVMQRIGQELHDGVAQHLSLAGLRLTDGDTKSAKDEVTVRTSLDAAMRELRAISRGLSLPDIENLNLANTISRAIQDHKQAFAQQVHENFEDSLKIPAPSSIKLCCYRFVQEALFNTYKHAEASKVTVDAMVDSTGIRVSVRDNGRGFDAEARDLVREDGGQGLMGLRDRVEALGGRMDIESNQDFGTRISLTLPTTETGL